MGHGVKRDGRSGETGETGQKTEDRLRIAERRRAHGARRRAIWVNWLRRHYATLSFVVRGTVHSA